MKALIFGATGLSGKHLTEVLLADNAFTEVVLFSRKSSGRQHPKLREVILDFDNMETQKADFQGDVAFNCLGTTLKKVGSEAAQQVIDRDYPIEIARLCAANGVKKMISVSSVGTDANSSNFYLRTKGEMENGVNQYFGKNALALRPSFLVGDRSEFRLGEKIGIYAMYLLDHLLLGGLRKYRSMRIENLAKAMANIAKKEVFEKNILEFDEIMSKI